MTANRFDPISMLTTTAVSLVKSVSKDAMDPGAKGGKDFSDTLNSLQRKEIAPVKNRPQSQEQQSHNPEPAQAADTKESDMPAKEAAETPVKRDASGKAGNHEEEAALEDTEAQDTQPDAQPDALQQALLAELFQLKLADLASTASGKEPEAASAIPGALDRDSAIPLQGDRLLSQWLEKLSAAPAPDLEGAPEEVKELVTRLTEAVRPAGIANLPEQAADAAREMKTGDLLKGLQQFMHEAKAQAAIPQGANSSEEAAPAVEVKSTLHTLMKALGIKPDSLHAAQASQAHAAAQAQATLQAVATQEESLAADTTQGETVFAATLSTLSADASSGQQAGDQPSGGEGEGADASAFPFLSGASAHAERSGGPAPVSFGHVMREMAQNVHLSPMDQAIAHIRSLTGKQGESHIQVQLAPENLGRLDIRLDVAGDGNTRLSITAENKGTLELLKSDVRVLENMLRDVGLKPDPGSLSFHLRDERQPGNGGQQQSGKGKGRAIETVDAVEEALKQTAVKAYTLASAEGLDMMI